MIDELNTFRLAKRFSNRGPSFFAVWIVNCELWVFDQWMTQSMCSSKQYVNHLGFNAPKPNRNVHNTPRCLVIEEWRPMHSYTPMTITDVQEKWLWCMSTCLKLRGKKPRIPTTDTQEKYHFQTMHSISKIYFVLFVLQQRRMSDFTVEHMR